MSIFNNLSISWGYLLTFVVGCWYGARWVRRYNVVLDRGMHRVMMDDLDYKTNALERLTGDDTGFVITSDQGDDESVEVGIDVFAEGEVFAEQPGIPNDDSDIRVCLD